MTTLQLRHVDCFTDRHGHKRFYFRRGHGQRMALPGLPGDELYGRLSGRTWLIEAYRETRHEKAARRAGHV